jgi:hyaluronate lyase
MVRHSSTHALAAQQIKVEGFEANKSWLIDNNRIHCLGSDISGPGKVETTIVHQPIEDNDAVMIDRRRYDAEGVIQCEPGWIWVAGMGYVFPVPQRVHVSVETRRSDWSSIRKPERFGAGEQVEHRYATVWIEHDQDHRWYDYVMLPAVTVDQMPELASQVAADLVTRCSSRESVGQTGARFHRFLLRDGDVSAAVLWQAGATDDGAVEASGPMLLLRSGKTTRVVDPTWRDRPVEVTFEGQTQQILSVDGRARDW